MSKEINLEDIILKETEFVSKTNEYVYNIDDLKRCMKEACKQALELAVENSDVKYDYGYTVAKQSILETINQIK